jgi:hypothetical protein
MIRHHPIAGAIAIPPPNAIANAAHSGTSRKRRLTPNAAATQTMQPIAISGGRS